MGLGYRACFPTAIFKGAERHSQSASPNAALLIHFLTQFAGQLLRLEIQILPGNAKKPPTAT